MNNDLISRSALLGQRPEYLDPNHVNAEQALFAKGWNACNSEHYSIISEAPSIDAEVVRHGKNLNASYKSLFKCSECDWECWDTLCGDTDTYNYCPNCGAKMRGDVNAED